MINLYLTKLPQRRIDITYNNCHNYLRINIVSNNIAKYHLAQDLEMCQYRLCIGDNKVTRNRFNKKRYNFFVFCNDHIALDIIKIDMIDIYISANICFLPSNVALQDGRWRPIKGPRQM